jgi:DNA-binding NarL/FixJ family response regulator
MPPTHTEERLEAARAIRDEFPHIPILLLSAHIEVEHARELPASGDRVGHLLKSCVTDVEQLTQTLDRVARGGSVIDPALVHELVSARRRDDPPAVLSPRAREVLALMAEGRSDTGIARQLWVTEGTVEKHVHSILTKLALPVTDDDHRVLAVVTFLEARQRLRIVRPTLSQIRAWIALADRDDLGIGELGLGVSGGQLQRIALVRASAAPATSPRLLVLDDQFSAVDADTEVRIIAALREAVDPDGPPEHQATVLLCSTRVAAFTHADEVSRASSSRRARSAALMARTRAAASSMPSGSQSRRRRAAICRFLQRRSA